MLQKENRGFRINVIVFSLIGILFYIFYFLTSEDTLKANPLYLEGAVGIPISIIGGVGTYYYFRYMKFPIIKIAIFSALFMLCWIIGVITIGTNLEGTQNSIAAILWIGILTVMYFMAIGGINGIFGYWISIFNILVVLNTIFYSQDINPAIWVNILDVVGIENIYFQWTIVFISAILGFSEKGMELVNIKELTN